MEDTDYDLRVRWACTGPGVSQLQRGGKPAVRPLATALKRRRQLHRLGVQLKAPVLLEERQAAVEARGTCLGRHDLERPHVVKSLARHVARAL